jgi:hypothetical protein
MPVIDDESVRDIIVGIFQINARLGDIARELRAIRRLLEEDDDGEERDDND